MKLDPEDYNDIKNIVEELEVLRDRCGFHACETFDGDSSADERKRDYCEEAESSIQEAIAYMKKAMK